MTSLPITYAEDEPAMTNDPDSVHPSAADAVAVSGSDVPARPTSLAGDATAKPVGFVRFITGRDAPQVEWCADVEIRRDTPLYARPTMPAGMPTGYVPVPREATQRMLDAADKIIDCDPQWVAKAWNAMLAASPPLPQELGAVPQWMPIETAPKDGSHVRLYRPVIQFVGYFATRAECWCINAPGLPIMEPAPTHWMPLDWPPVADPGQAQMGETKWANKAQ